jgi:hypothetical protein
MALSYVIARAVARSNLLLNRSSSSLGILVYKEIVSSG